MTAADKEFLALFHDFPDGVFRIDLEGRYTVVNEHYAVIFGYAPDKMIEGGLDVWGRGQSMTRFIFSSARQGGGTSRGSTSGPKPGQEALCT